MNNYSHQYNTNQNSRRFLGFNGNGYDNVNLNNQQHSQINGYFNNTTSLPNIQQYMNINEHQYPTNTTTTRNNEYFEYNNAMLPEANMDLPHTSNHKCGECSPSSTCEACWMLVCKKCHMNHEENKVTDNEAMYKREPHNRKKLHDLCNEQGIKVRKTIDQLQNASSKIDMNYQKSLDQIKSYMDPLRDALDNLANEFKRTLDTIKENKIQSIQNQSSYLQAKLPEFSNAIKFIQSDAKLEEEQINTILYQTASFQSYYSTMKITSDVFEVNINDSDNFFDKIINLCANSRKIFEISSNNNIPIIRRICNASNRNGHGSYNAKKQFENNRCEVLERYPGKCVPDSCIKVKAIESVSNYFHYFAYEGRESGQVCHPWGICADKNSNIILSDRRNHRIQIFDTQFQVITIFGSEGSENGQFKLPAGVTTTPQNEIAVVDKDNHRVQIFSKIGVFMRKFGGQGTAPGKFSYPWGIACNSIGEMAVTDSKNGRLQLFTTEGALIAWLPFDNHAFDRRVQASASPRGVCFTSEGNLLVTDFEYNIIHVIKRCKDQLIKTGFGPGRGIFSRPSGIACDDVNKFVIADSKNQKIRVYYGGQYEQTFCIDLLTLEHPSLSNDRPSDVTILPNGNIAAILEPSPESSKDKYIDRNKPHVIIFAAP